jgi:hypothetical protein
MNWVKIAVGIMDDPSVRQVAEAVGVSEVTTTGHLVGVFTNLATHAKNGDISQVSEATVEAWARWRGKRGKFAQAFRAYLCDQQGVVKAWEAYNGAAIREFEHDRIRKAEARKKARDVRRTSAGQSSGRAPDVHRYETRRDETKEKKTDRLVSTSGETTPADRSVGREATPGQRTTEPHLPTPAVFGGERPDPVRQLDRSHYAEQEAALRAAALPHESRALDALLHNHAFPDQLVLELASFASGMKVLRGEHTGRAADIADVMRAVAEMAANGQPWSVRLFRGYLRKIVDRAPEPPTTEEREAKKLAAQIAAQTPAVRPEPPRTPEEIAALAEQRQKAMQHWRAQFGQYNPERQELAA